ncbi:AbfB domain-containing protein [Streptomyces sp. NPDC093085]|uniref:AbfB domain-containing protein n=1 Tax=Streptomyces sp. NPDC093085 TaxID=3155068 RepID=UPI00343588F1
MSEMSGADPTRPIDPRPVDQEPPAGPPGAVPVPPGGLPSSATPSAAPGKGISALMAGLNGRTGTPKGARKGAAKGGSRHAAPPPGPDPADLELFADPDPGPCPTLAPARATPAALPSAQNRPRALPRGLPPERMPNGLGFPGGSGGSGGASVPAGAALSAGATGLLPVPPTGTPTGGGGPHTPYDPYGHADPYGPSDPYGPQGPHGFADAAAKSEEDERYPRSLWVTVLVGVAALACGITLITMTGGNDREAGRASAPVTDLTVPGLRGYPVPPEGNPGDSHDSAGSLSDAESSGSDTQNKDSSKEAPHATGSPDAPAEESAGGSAGGAPADDKGDSGTDKGKGEGSGTGSKEGSDPGPGTSPAGSGGSSSTGGGKGGSVGQPVNSPNREASMQAVNYPDRYWNIRGDGLGYLDSVSRNSAALTVKKGLSDERCYSFTLSDGRYVRHQNFRLRAAKNDGSALFGKDATFCPRTVGYGYGYGNGNGNGGQIMLESVNYPGRYIRHRNFQLWLDPYQNSNTYRADSAFRMVTD